MKIAVCAAKDLASPYAHAINTFKTAQAFSRIGHDVTIICLESSAPDQTIQYGIQDDIKILTVSKKYSTDKDFSSQAIKILQQYDFDFVFVRSYALPLLCCEVGIPVIGESHAHTNNVSKPFMDFVKNTNQTLFLGWITISHYLSQHYQSLGVKRKKILVLPDAVDLEQFSRPQNIGPSPYQGNNNIVYCGHLYDYKGIPTILETAARTPHVNFHLIGGLSEDIKRHDNTIKKLKIKNVLLHGHHDHNQVPPYLWHADCLLLTPSANHPSAKWTSPVKLGEYLASGSPVIASDIQALKHWLSSNEVLFVEADSVETLQAGIIKLLNSPTACQKLVKASIKKSKKLSYENRCKQILKLYTGESYL